MPMRKGQVNGGIHTIQDLHGRCVIDADTRCWHLRRADGKPLRQEAKGVPTINTMRDGQPIKVSARRWAWEQLHGPIEGDKVVTWSCRSWDCVNPAHLRCLPRRAHVDLMVKKGAFRTVAKAKANLATRRARADVKLTPELAQWVRESSQTQRQIAHALDVSQQRISDILRGKVWKTELMHASVFTYAPPASQQRRAA